LSSPKTINIEWTKRFYDVAVRVAYELLFYSVSTMRGGKNTAEKTNMVNHKAKQLRECTDIKLNSHSHRFIFFQIID
jgi:hypothetical protein